MSVRYRGAVRTPYLGDTLVWEFRDDDERAVYFSTRQRREYRVLSVAVLAVLFVGFLIAWIQKGYSVVLPVAAALALVWELVRWRVERSGGLTALQLRLHPKKIMLTEIYGDPSIWRNKDMVVILASHIKALQWANAGCHVMFKGAVLSPRKCVLPMGVFATQRSVDALHRWAEVHGITVEGVPPLPGAYVRPIEERRGL